MARKIKFILYLLSLVFFFQGTGLGAQPCPVSFLVTMIQDPQALSSREEIDKLVQTADKAQVKNLYIQVYRANQAWFPSYLADQSPYDACAKKVGGDPLSLLISESHKKGIKVFAWFNALSLSKNKNAPILKRYGYTVLTRNLKEKKSLDDYKIDNQYFLEPGDPRVKKDLLGIVEEIVRRYPSLDGILFDYIRYPDVHPVYGYTSINIARYKESTGQKVVLEKDETWRRWKRDQVTALLQALAQKARQIRPQISVAATGCVSYVRAYEESFQDWPSWVNRGIVDFVALMDYPIDVDEFKKYIVEAKQKVNDFTKVHIAVGAYKLVKMPDVFFKQFSFAQQAGGGGCIIFHYGSFLENPALGRFLFGKNDAP